MRKPVWAQWVIAIVLAATMGCGGGGGGGGGIPAYLQADLAGNWGFHVLGANPTGSVWGHGIFTIDNAGNAVVTTQSWSDNSLPGNTTFTLAGDGVLGVVGTDVHGFMSIDKNTVVDTFSNGAGGMSIRLLQRIGATAFSQTDLSGEWGFNVLGGTPTGNGSSWGRGKYSIDASGNGVVTAQTWSDNTPHFDNTNFTLSVDGVMGAAGIDNVHGILSIGDNMVVATFTNVAGGSSLWVLQRVDGAVFSQADLSGTWGCHLLGLTPTGSAWGYGEYSISATGNGVVTTQFSSNSLPVFSSRTFTLSGAGDLSTNGGERGFMSVDKKTMVATFTNVGGGSSFWLLQKR